MPGPAVRSRIEIETRSRTEVIDITDRVGQLVEGRGDGLCYLFNKHTTSALMVITAEMGVPEDIMDILQTLTPKLDFRHDSAAHVAAHFLSGLVGPCVSVRRREIEVRLLSL